LRFSFFGIWGLALALVIDEGCGFVGHWLGIDGKEKWFV